MVEISTLLLLRKRQSPNSIPRRMNKSKFFEGEKRLNVIWCGKVWGENLRSFQDFLKKIKLNMSVFFKNILNKLLISFTTFSFYFHFSGQSLMTLRVFSSSLTSRQPPKIQVRSTLCLRDSIDSS